MYFFEQNWFPNKTKKLLAGCYQGIYSSLGEEDRPNPTPSLFMFFIIEMNYESFWCLKCASLKQFLKLSEMYLFKIKILF